MTAEQRAELLAKLQTEEREAKELREKQIATYKEMAADAVDECFPVLVENSKFLGQSKVRVYDTFGAIIELKEELFGVKEGQQSHTYTNRTGTRRVTLGYYVIDNYDDTVDAGIAMVKEYLNNLRDGSTANDQLVDMCLSLLSKDKKGTLKASRVMSLRKYAQESGAERFIEGVEIIMNAYQPIMSKRYIKAEQKNSVNAWATIPLGMTEA